MELSSLIVSSYIKRSLTVGLLIILSFNCSAQSDFSAVLKSLSITAPSPTASALGEYGKSPVGLATGTPEITIPLYTVETQHLKLPLQLRYSSNGIKVDAIASRTGMGWMLDAGGVITRNVNGSPDETSAWLPFTTIEGRAGVKYMQKAAAVAEGNLLTWDTQPDLFAYNFGGYMGKFTLDSARSIVLIKLENLKIEYYFVQGVLNFKITAPDGVIYFFGGFGATEYTKPPSSSGICEVNYVRPSATAWYLTKIVHPKGDSIMFKYQGFTSTYEAGISQIYIAKTYGSPTYDCREGMVCDAFGNSTCLSRLRVDAFALSEINTSLGDKIQLINTPRLDVNNELLLDSIQIYHKKDLATPYRIIDLQYTYSQSRERYTNGHFTNPQYSKRLFLTDVTEKAGGNTYKKHSFYYNDYDGLPERLSFSQDDYGYFNGKANAYLIPTPPSNYQKEFPTINADRSADPNYAGKGLLSKIVFPTGGYDTLIYEGHTINVTEPVIIPAPGSNITITTVGQGVKNLKRVDTLFTPGFQQSVGFDFKCEVVPGKSYEALDNYMIVRIYQGTSEIYKTTVNVGSPVSYIKSLSGGQPYKVELSVYGNVVRGTAQFTYYTQQGQTTYQDRDKFIGGMRIAQIKSFSSERGFHDSRKFYYGIPTNLLKSSGHIVEYVWGYFAEFPVRFICGYKTEPSSGFQIANCERKAAYSSTIHNSFGNAASHIYYSSVLESKGDDFENGGIWSIFKNRSNDEADLILGYQPHGMTTSNVAWENGLKTSELYFSKVNNNYIKKKEITYNYKIDQRYKRDLLGYLVRRRYDDIVVNPDTSPVNPEEYAMYDVLRYPVTGNWTYLDTTVTTIYDDNGQTLTTKSAYTYDNVLHTNPTRIWGTRSDGQEQIVNISYPLDYASGTAFLDSLKIANIVNVPIETVKYLKQGTETKVLEGAISLYNADRKGTKKSELLFSSADPVALSEFKFSNNAKGLLPPAGIPAIFSQDPRYEERVAYDGYDLAGNLSHYVLNQQKGICYIWGYDARYPIAEVKNADLSDVAYTSFESAEWGNWSSASNTFIANDGLSGKQCYALNSGAVSKSGLSSSKKYVVSYWVKSGTIVNVNGTVSTITGVTYNNWTYNEKIVTGVSTVIVSGSGNIDELRLYPQQAQINTTTYEPGVGVTGKFDEKGGLTYYEYDAFGRLKLIKDQNGRILQQYDYQYNATL
jgi:YD repeat-containing protein